MAFPDIVIGSKFDGKGFKQAETALTKLGKSAKGVGELLGVSLGAAAVVAYCNGVSIALSNSNRLRCSPIRPHKGAARVLGI